MIEKTVSTTDPDSGMFVKGEHERGRLRMKHIPHATAEVLC